MDVTQVLRPVQDSLVRRMRTMFSLHYDAVDTMSLEQVNHVDQPARFPIAFSLFHHVNIQDSSERARCSGLHSNTNDAPGDLECWRKSTAT